MQDALSFINAHLSIFKMLLDQLDKPGEHELLIPGLAGMIETKLSVPNIPKQNLIAIVGHPHSLQGGTMNNKVVTTLARLFKELNIPSIRFNFRGVGRSEGTYDAGIGESLDMLMFAALCLQKNPDTRFIFAGFSFGSYVSYRAAAQCPHELLISVAPSVHHYNYAEFKNVPNPWIIAQGDQDEIVPWSAVETFVEGAPASINLLRFHETTHFFHGKLLDLRERLVETIAAQAPELCA